MAQRVPRRTTSPPAVLPPAQRLRWAVVAVLGLLGLLTLVGAALFVPGWVAPGGAPGASTVRGIAVAALVVVFAAGTCSAYWRFRLEVLAWRPGPIAVLPFRRDADATSSVPPREFQAMFERALVRCRFSGATPVPTLGRPTDFLSVVESAADDLSGAWGAATRFVRLLAPESAYAVGCTVLPSQPHAAHVVLVEISRIGRASGTQILVEENTALRAAELAAHATAARILPRTAACASSPWSLWQDLHLPTELVDAYQRFQRLRADRHMDGALQALREAIRQDPRNLALRLELGKLQERMQMYLDALLTYDDVITVAARRDRRLGAWWGATVHRPPLPGPAGRSEVDPAGPAPDLPGYVLRSDERQTRGLHRGHTVILIARYRHALLLGFSQELAAEWWGREERCPTGAHQSAREARRAYLRRALATRLTRRYEGIITGDLVRVGGDPETVPEPPDYLGALGATTADDRAPLAALARVFFTTVSQLECEHLLDDYVRFQWWEPRPIVLPRTAGAWRPVLRLRLGTRPRPGSSRRRDLRAAVLSREALLTLLPWACMRRAMALSNAASRAPDRGTPDVALAGMAVIDQERPAFLRSKAIFEGGWPVGTRDVESTVGSIIGSPYPRLLTWRAHYNAACTLALPLLADDSDRHNGLREPDRSRATRAAVGELERAVACADSGHLARQRDWLLSEDPDLDQLRGAPEFQDFEATTFGSIHAAERRGPEIDRWEQAAYVATLITTAAGLMADLWRGRMADGPSPATLETWLDEEIASWELAERLAIDSRDSRTRHDVASRIGRWVSEPEFDVPPVPHPEFSRRMLDHQLASLRGHERSRLLAERHLAEPPPVTVGVTAAVRLGDKRLSAFMTGLRVGGRGCCSFGRTSVLAVEEAHLRAAIDGAAGSDAPPDLVTRWCAVNERRWAALAILFDDTVLGRSRKARQRALTEALVSPWWSEPASVPDRRDGR